MTTMNNNNSSEWDQRQLFNMRLHENLIIADRCSLNDDYDNYYDALRNAYRSINFFMTEDERKELEIILDDARKWCKVSSNKRRLVDITIVQDKLDIAHKLIYNMSHKYKLMIPRADTQGSAMKELF